MGDMAAFWGYEESHSDVEQLGQKLLLTTLELEKLKSEAMEEISKNKEHINQLIHLLKHALHERDQAKSQLHNLLNNNNNNNNNSSSFPAKANSSVTESNSLSDHHHHNHHSPADSIFDGVVVSSSNDHFSNANAATAASGLYKAVDQGSLVIDDIARGRALPQKGKFLQAVVRAGPLLQTLLVAGPLPRWRNPPRFDPFQIPPPLSAIRGYNQGDLGLPKAAFGQAQVQSAAAPMMDFAGMSHRASGPGIGSYASLAKKQRFC